MTKKSGNGASVSARDINSNEGGADKHDSVLHKLGVPAGLGTMRALEPRILLDAAALATFSDAASDQAALEASQWQREQQPDLPHTGEGFSALPTPVQVEQSPPLPLIDENSLNDDFSLTDGPTTSGSNQIVFIDSAIEDLQSIVESIGDGIEIVIIDANSDGYILSDALGVENLQARGFATAKWWLREKLFGLGKPAPEHLSTRMRRFVIAHSFGVWIYRFFLFLGIALLVYHFFFKVLGVVMFIIEMVWFIAMPITNEIKEWWKMRDEIKQKSRYRWSMAILGLGLFALAYPFSTSVQVPAILSQKQEVVLHAPFPAKILEVKMHEDMQVKKGQVLLRLGSDELNQKITDTRLELKSIKTRTARAHADQKERSQYQVLTRQSYATSQKLKGLNAKLEDLKIRAPHDGLLVDPQSDLHSGRWIDPKLRLAMVRSINQPQFKALADEQSRLRISNGATGVFFPDDFQLPAIDVKLIAMANVSGTGNELVYLSEIAGSMVSLNPETDNGLKARNAWFALRLKPVEMQFSPDMVLRGIIVLEAEPVSMLSRIMRQVASVLVREAGI